jgi:hypothetical protein
MIWEGEYGDDEACLLTPGLDLFCNLRAIFSRCARMRSNSNRTIPNHRRHFFVEFQNEKASKLNRIPANELIKKAFFEKCETKSVGKEQNIDFEAGLLIFFPSKNIN